MIKKYDSMLFIIRLAVGIIFVAHGMQKVFGAFGGEGMESMISSVKSLGFVAPVFFAWLAALSELVGGFCLIIGVLPRISAFLIGFVMLVAIFKVHWGNGFFLQNQGVEYQFLILFNCLAIIIAGAGKISSYDKY